MACPPESENFSRPASSNTTQGECVDNSSLNSHSPKTQKDGSSLQVGHFCRLPDGQMEWVHNPYLPRGAEYQADVEMTTPLPQGSTSHAANESGSTSRRSVMANMFEKRMQTLRENRTQKGNKEAPRIYSDPTQAESLPDSTESIQVSAEKRNSHMVPHMSSVLTAKSSNPRLVQQIPPVTLLQYQKRPNRVSKNTSEPRRQVRTRAVLPKMGTVLEELEDEAQIPTVVPPPNALVPFAIEEDHNGPTQH